MKKINFKRGAGEMIEMAVTLPMLLVLVFLLISLFQISKCEQRLIYASYFCGRTAAISFDAETARHNVEDVLKDINADGSNIDYTMDVRGSWIKGNFVVITVHEDINTVLGFGSGLHNRKVAMMIEHSKWID